MVSCITVSIDCALIHYSKMYCIEPGFCAVYDAFEHWKCLVRLLCMSESALSENTDLFSNFIS